MCFSIMLDQFCRLGLAGIGQLRKAFWKPRLVVVVRIPISTFFFLAIFLHHQFFSCFTDNENSIPVPLLPRASSNFLPSFTQTQNKHRTKTKKTCIIARKKLYRLFISFKVTNQLKSVQKHKHKASFVLFMVEYC